TILGGGIHAAHTPRDRRKLLPVSPVERQGAGAAVALPGHGAGAAPGAGAASGEPVESAPADLPEGLA
ncbi:30S ribosomal protein S12 methylthiotransferase RimO, partial [Streptomyces sp. TRM76130]|nr:30S ribosomal protein S12 methylthiotransferase RimO [Streptomyces sp. TRM76130]